MGDGLGRAENSVGTGGSFVMYVARAIWMAAEDTPTFRKLHEGRS